jgi:membrane protein implicated in regulation of membrane protease activity
MSPTQTIFLVLAGALFAVAGLTATVHFRWLPYDIALWIAMAVVFIAWRALQPALRAREGERRKSR